VVSVPMKILITLLALALPLSATAPRNIKTSQQATAQQQVIDFDLALASDLSACTVVVYSDSARTLPVLDSDTTIRANAQACNRGALDTDLSSIVSFGTHVQFISGLRGTRKSAADAKLYSMSLAPLTTYYYTITAGGSSVNGQFTTANIPVGAVFPDAPLSDTTGTNAHGLEYPYIADNAPGTVVNDPTTGIPIARVPLLVKNMAGLTAFSTTAIDVAATGHWTNLANCGSNNASVCTGTGAAATDYLFIPFPNLVVNYASASGWGGVIVDDMVFTPYCGSTSVQQTLRVWLTRDSGQTAASDYFDVTCPSTGHVVRPTISDTVNGYPHPFWNQWAPVKEWIKAEVIAGTGTVTVSGTAVSWASGDPFITSIPANSNIRIGSTYYKIASFTNSTHLTLTGGGASSGAYTMAATGLRIANVTATNTVTLSVGYNAAETVPTGGGTSQALNPPCNVNPITVSWAADGVTAIPATNGLLCTDGENTVFLYIPFNADGTVRLDIRAISASYIPYGSSQVTSIDAGYPFGGLSSIFFDSTDPYTYYGLGNSAFHPIVVKGVYNPAHSTACARFTPYSYGSANGFTVGGTILQDCIDWTNLTPVTSSPAKDIRAQMMAAYPTGLNQLGVQVSAAHPYMGDIGWMSFVSDLRVIGSQVCVWMLQGQGYFGAGGCFDTTTGILKSMGDSFSTWPAMAAGAHSIGGWNALGLTWDSIAAGITLYPSNPSVFPFSQPFEAAVSQINTAGFGSTPNWVAASSINGTGVMTAANKYTCPTFTDSKVTGAFSAWSGQPECVQLRFTTPMCSHNPAPNIAGGGYYDFPGGLSEGQAFPCTTPGFGVPSGASGYSMIWPFFPGMWLWNVTIQNLGGENFVVATAPTYNSANSMDVWLIREAKDKAVPGCAGEVSNDWTNHTAPFSLAVWMPFTCSYNIWWWDTTDPTGAMHYDTAGSSAHGTIGVGAAPNTHTFVEAGDPFYVVKPNRPQGDYPPGIFNSPLSFSGIDSPKFAGFTHVAVSGVDVQGYPNLTAASVLAAPNDRKMIDNRALNSASGYATCLRNGLTITLQGGTTQTYLLNDPSGTVATTDPHVSVLARWAGSHFLRDYSGPSTGNVFGDTQTWGICYVYKVNECRTGSTPGQVYVSVPFAENSLGCIEVQHPERNVPGVMNMSSVSGQVTQVDQYTFDPNQILFRKLGFGFRAPGMHNVYQHTWGMPDGRGIFGRVDGADARWTGMYVGALPPWPSIGSSTTAGYYSLPLTLGTYTSGTKARVLFGYAENGSTAANLYCMSRAEGCSTEGAPFAFLLSDTRTLLTCDTGCPIDVPLIRGRVAFIQEQRLSSDGATVLASGPVQAVVMP
jgi:hypothetical protein